ncbi:hypothetical protein HDU91_004223, partial [Kappamyces sp. JEL0680]
NGPKQFTATIPDQIWTYWDREPVDPVISHCIATWKEANGPDFSVTILSRQNLAQHLSTPLPQHFDEIQAAFRADWIRLAVLKEKGGYWVDASFIMTKSLHLLSSIVEKDDTEGFMFYLEGWTWDPMYPYFENWLIAARPGSKLIEAWLNEFTIVVNDYAMSDMYLAHLKKTYGAEQYQNMIQGNPMPSYLKQHMALQKIMQIDGILPFSGVDATDGSIGPLHLTQQSEWDNAKMGRMMLEPWDSARPVPAFIKIRSEERKWIAYYSRDPLPASRKAFTLKWRLWNWRELLAAN